MQSSTEHLFTILRTPPPLPSIIVWHTGSKGRQGQSQGLGQARMPNRAEPTPSHPNITPHYWYSTDIPFYLLLLYSTLLYSTLPCCCAPYSITVDTCGLIYAALLHPTQPSHTMRDMRCTTLHRPPLSCFYFIDCTYQNRLRSSPHHTLTLI